LIFKFPCLINNMGFDIIIHSPPTILIIAGVLFLAFNDEINGWILIAVGVILAILVTYISAKSKIKPPV